MLIDSVGPGGAVLLPTKIVHPYERIPFATNSLIVVNALVFVFTIGRMDEIVWRHGLSTFDFSAHQLLTALFLHGSFFHLVGNVLFLGVYGRYVEDRLGPWRFLAVYGLCGLGADLAYLLTTDLGVLIGASGAVSGLLGFVLVGAPWVEVRLVWIWGPHVRPTSMPAFWLVGVWFFWQVLLWAALPFSRVAYSAHVGGTVAGCAIAFVLRLPRWKGTGWWLDPAPPGGGEGSTRRLRRARGAGTAQPTPQHGVRVTSLVGCPSLVAVVKRLMVRCGLEPAAAKARLDEVSRGAPQTFEVPDAAVADALAAELRDLGATAAVSSETASTRI